MTMECAVPLTNRHPPGSYRKLADTPLARSNHSFCGVPTKCFVVLLALSSLCVNAGTYIYMGVYAFDCVGPPKPTSSPRDERSVDDNPAAPAETEMMPQPLPVVAAAAGTTTKEPLYLEDLMRRIHLVRTQPDKLHQADVVEHASSGELLLPETAAYKSKTTHTSTSSKKGGAGAEPNMILAVICLVCGCGLALTILCGCACGWSSPSCMCGWYFFLILNASLRLICFAIFLAIGCQLWWTNILFMVADIVMVVIVKAVWGKMLGMRRGDEFLKSDPEVVVAAGY